MKVPQINLVELLLELLYLPRWESVKWCKEHNKYKIYPVNTTKHFLLNKKKTTIEYLAGFSTLLLIPF